MSAQRVSELFTWRTAIIRAGDLSGRAKHVALTLACFMNEAGDGAFPGLETLAGCCSKGKRYVIDGLAELDVCGYLVKTVGGGRGNANRYTARFPERVLQEHRFRSGGRAAAAPQESPVGASGAVLSGSDEDAPGPAYAGNETVSSQHRIGGSRGAGETVRSASETVRSMHVNGAATAPNHVSTTESTTPTAAEPLQLPSVARSDDGDGNARFSAAAPAVGQAPSFECVLATLDGFRNADLGSIAVVEPLAKQLTGEVFDEVVATARQRVATGTVLNDVGLLVKLLRERLRKQRRDEGMAAAAAAAAQEAEIRQARENVKRADPERYLRRLLSHPAVAPAEFVAAFLDRYVDDPAERDRLRQLEQELRGETHQARFERWIRETAPEVAPDVVRQEIDEWCDERGLDHTERAHLQQLAEEAREPKPALRVAGAEEAA